MDARESTDKQLAVDNSINLKPLMTEQEQHEKATAHRHEFASFSPYVSSKDPHWPVTDKNRNEPAYLSSEGVVSRKLHWEKLVYLIESKQTGEIGRLAKDYAIYRETSLLNRRDYESLEDYIRHVKLDGTVELVNGKWRCTETKTSIKFTSNRFPYALTDDIRHDIIWSSHPLAPEQVEACIRENMRGREFVYYSNLVQHQSVKGVFHAQVFSRPIDPKEKPETKDKTRHYDMELLKDAQKKSLEWIDDLKEETSVLKEENALLMGSNQRIQNENEQLKRQVQFLKDQIGIPAVECMADLSRLKEQVKKFEDEHAKLKSEFADVSDRLVGLTEENKQLKEEKTLTLSAMELSQEEVKKMKEKLATVSERLRAYQSLVLDAVQLLSISATKTLALCFPVRDEILKELNEVLKK